MARANAWRRKDVIEFLGRIGVDHPSGRYREAVGKLTVDKRVPPELRVASVVFRMHLDFLESLNLLALLELTPGQNGEPRTSAGITALAYLYNDGVAMLILCLQGLDVQARIILRSYLERLDLLITVLTDAEVAQEYVKDSTLEGSQSFFFRRTSKGKLKKSALRGFAAAVPSLAEFGRWIWDEFRPEVDKVVGAAAHSNHTVGLISMFPNLHRGRSAAIGLGGFPNNGSLRTLNDALICAVPLAALHNQLPLFKPSNFFARELPEEAELAVRGASDGARFGMLFPVADSMMREYGRPK